MSVRWQLGPIRQRSYGIKYIRGPLSLIGWTAIKYLSYERNKSHFSVIQEYLVTLTRANDFISSSIQHYSNFSTIGVFYKW
jgi:hypothetical protein